MLMARAALLVLPRLVMLPPRPALHAVRRASARAQFDDSARVAAPPSDKSLRYAQTLAMQTETAMPDDVSSDQMACSAFIDEMLNKIPPTAKQLEYASSLAERAGIPLPPEVEVSQGACKRFLTEQAPQGASGGGGNMAGQAGVVPTEKQLLYAISLAQKRNIGISADALADKRACSQFIDSLVNGGDGAAAAAPTAYGDPFAQPAEAPPAYGDPFAQPAEAPPAYGDPFAQPAEAPPASKPPATFVDGDIPF